MGVTLFSGLAGSFGLAGWLRDGEKTQEGEATGGGDEPVEWRPVATALGAIEANLIAGRLNNEGIPTRINQEAAGAAIGLSVGLGRIRVLVPEPMADRALLILEEPVAFVDGDWETDGEGAD